MVMSGGLTKDHLDWTSSFTKLPVAGAGGTAPGGASPDALKKVTDKIQGYLRTNKLRRHPNTPDLSKVWFNEKLVPLETCVKTTLGAAGMMFNGPEAELVNEALVTRIVRAMAAPDLRAPANAAAGTPQAGGDTKQDDGDGKKAAKGDDDGPEVSVASSSEGKLDTQVKYTVKLLAKSDDEDKVLQVLPDAEITFHTSAGIDSPSLEGQINLLKANISKALKIDSKFKGKVKIEATLSAGTELKLAPAAVGKFKDALESKITAELSVGIGKHLEIKPGLDVGMDGKPKAGVGVEIHF
jgi:hypothetical protein